MKKVLLIHGFNGIPKIFLYFKSTLELKGYDVIIPDFPTREKITLNSYFDVFDKYKNIMNDELIVIAHSIGNIMFIKYIAQNNIKIAKYISLAGFAEPFYVEGKDVLNKVIKPLHISTEEKNKVKFLINEKYSIYSDNDHIVPLDLLESYCNVINSKPIFIPGIGHMGKKSCLEKLPEVIDLVSK